MLERKWFASTLLRAHSLAVQNSVGRGVFLPRYASVALHPTNEQAPSMHCTRIPLSSLPEEQAEQAAWRNPKPTLLFHTGSLWRTRSPPHNYKAPSSQSSPSHPPPQVPDSCYPCQHPGGRGLRFCDRSSPPSAGECVSLCCSLKDWGERSAASSQPPASRREQPGPGGSQTCCYAWWGR